MKTTTSAFVAAAIGLASFAAQAQQSPASTTPWYAELGYTAVSVRAFGAKVDPHAVRAIVGYNVHSNIAVEGMLAGGVASDNGVKVKNAAGIFVKPKLTVDNLELFARLGWVQSRLAGGGATAKDDDFAWGAGLNYSINPRTYVSLDYVQYYNKSPVRVDGVTLGVGFRF